MKLFIFLALLLISASLNAQLTKKHIVHFEFGSSEISQQEKEDIKTFIASLKGGQIASVNISGFADDIGPIQLNKEISIARAQALQKVFLGSKLSDEKINSIKGAGSIPLQNPQNASAERIQNRRAELEIELEPTPEEEIIEEIVEKKFNPLFTEKSEVGEMMELHNILFEPGSSDMYPQSKYELDRLLFYLKKYDNIHILIQGHICCQKDGRDGINDETGLRNLSEARAQAVYFFLVRKGIDKKRLDFKGMKGNFPLGLGDQRDRRVEIQIIKN